MSPGVGGGSQAKISAFCLFPIFGCSKQKKNPKRFLETFYAGDVNQRLVQPIGDTELVRQVDQFDQTFPKEFDETEGTPCWRIFKPSIKPINGKDPKLCLFLRTYVEVKMSLRLFNCSKQSEEGCGVPPSYS